MAEPSSQDSSASPHAITEEPAFLDLPTDIRELIYKHYFTQNPPGPYSIVCINGGVIVRCSNEVTYLLRTCKQVHNEAWPFFAKKIMLTTTYHDHIIASRYMPSSLKLHLENLQINYQTLRSDEDLSTPIRVTFPNLVNLNIAVMLGRDWDPLLTQNPPLSDTEITDRVVSSLGIQDWLDHSVRGGRQSLLSVVIMISIRAAAARRNDYCIPCSYGPHGCFGLAIGVSEKTVIRHRARHMFYDDFELARRALKGEATFSDESWTTSVCTSANGHQG